MNLSLSLKSNSVSSQHLDPELNFRARFLKFRLRLQMVRVFGRSVGRLYSHMGAYFEAL